MTYFLSLPKGFRTLRKQTLKNMFAATMLCALIAGCGGDDDDSDAGPETVPTQASDGSAAAAVAIVAAPATGTCGESGTEVPAPHALNSKLDCAP